MTNSSQHNPASGRPGSPRLLRSVVLSAIVPAGIYWCAKHFASSSEVAALCAASVFPLLYSLCEFVERRSYDLIAIFSLLGIAVSLVGVYLGGSVKILLIRESLFTGALGLACLISLLLPRPLMFYVGRQFMTGNDPTLVAAFDARWQYPYARYVNRLITVVWGLAYLGEFTLRVVLVNMLSPALVLVISPFLLGGITTAAVVWTVAYVRYAEKRGAEMRRQREEAESARTPGP
jgi:hypothetical protein